MAVRNDFGVVLVDEMMDEPFEEQTEKRPSSRMDRFRMFCFWIFVAGLVACAIALRLSVITPAVRALLVVTLLFGLFTGLLYLLRLFGSRPGALYPAIFFLGLFVVWAVLGNKPPDVVDLRDRYKWRLQTYQGAPYRQGGETDDAIDSSGLARAAMWQAMLCEGLSEFNSGLLGPKLWRFWWRDLSVSDILEGKYGYTEVIGHADQLAGYPTILLEKGDMAITEDGTHIMIYFGDEEWIEASPEDGKVVVNKAPADSPHRWFRRPVTLVRWSILASEE